jgi:hypothetical protein
MSFPAAEPMSMSPKWITTPILAGVSRRREYVRSSGSGGCRSRRSRGTASQRCFRSCRYGPMLKVNSYPCGNTARARTMGIVRSHPRYGRQPASDRLRVVLNTKVLVCAALKDKSLSAMAVHVVERCAFCLNRYSAPRNAIVLIRAASRQPARLRQARPAVVGGALRATAAAGVWKRARSTSSA